MSRVDEILFGADPTPGIVAVEPGRQSVSIYRRVDGRIVVEERPFHRWLLVLDRHNLPGARWTELEGSGFRWLAEFDTPEEFNNARFLLREAHAEHIAYPDAIRQYLTRSGQTFFKNLSFDSVVRMQIDIETLGLNPKAPENEVILVGIADNRGFEEAVAGPEREILRRVVEIVQERDPDVIEGHNILAFDLPYLAERAALRGVRLALGRDGSDLAFGPHLNCQIGGTSRPYRPALIAGRQVVDTLLAVQRFDASRGMLTSYGLKHVARALGIAEEDREIVPAERIASEWRANPDRVVKYCLQDVRETRTLAGLVLPADFYLAQMAPESYSRCATSGAGEKINCIFIREYLRCGKAIPRRGEPRPLPGGYAEVRRVGLIHRIVKCDVESLYPSIMLVERIKPTSDALDIFLPALEELTRRRVEAKRKARESEGSERAFWDGLQSSFKILINSFYGYLGGPFNFNDFEAAARVTSSGRSIAARLVAELEAAGAVVIEVDTDGVYFQPPPGVSDESAEMEFVNRVGRCLPEGIRLVHDGRYRAMLSLKIKNYVLWGYDGTRIFRGSALRSRADEPFGTEFISAAADLLERGDKEGVGELYEQFARQIEAGQLPLEKFARRERITDKTFTSSSRRRIAEVSGNAAIGDYVTIYQRRDGSIARAEDYNGDEDRDYLLDRLYRFALRLREAIGDDFDRLIPTPSERAKKNAAGQGTLNLFD